MSYHLTGQYPDWWEGKRFDSPILAWCVGITGDSTRKVLQKEMFGTESAKDTDELGTGAIPRDCIDFELLERDGNNLKIAKVKHVTGEYSTLEFRSTQQGEHVLMGATVDYIWLDEEDPYRSSEIYSQCVTRTATTGGLVTITATPENGETNLIRQFTEDATGFLYLQNATWSDAPHLTPEIQAELLASIPEWQREMRSKGIPVFGQGVVFNLPDSLILEDKPMIDNHDQILWSVDIGRTNDPTVLSLVVQKEDTYYLAEQYVSDEDRSPAWVCSILDTHTYVNAPVILPHDAGTGEGSFGQLMRMYGANVQAEAFYNPQQTTQSFIGSGQQHKRSIEAGLYQMVEAMKNNKLKVSNQCTEFLREKNSYHRTGKQGTNAYGGDDHCIDSFRYGYMSLLGHRGSPAGQCQKTTEDWNNGFMNDDEATGVPVFN
ncbi:terminase family protein [Vibrio breoganii]